MIKTTTTIIKIVSTNPSGITTEITTGTATAIEITIATETATGTITAGAIVTTGMTTGETRSLMETVDGAAGMAMPMI